MLKSVLLLIVICVSNITQAQNIKTESIKLADLEGKWYINQTNFPMWLKGNKTSPTFNYTIAFQKEDTVLLDCVRYTKNEKQKSIKGIDKATNAANTAFEWRGNGLLYILKSKWQILHFEPVEQWAVIFFEKTLFTPAGYDVISRKPKLSESTLQNVNRKVNALGVTDTLITLAQKHNG